MSQFHSWQNQEAMQLLQQQLLHNVTNERILPENFQLPLTTTVQPFPQHLNQYPNYPSQINPFHVSQFLPEQVFSQECATNYQHSSGLTSLDPTEEKILFGSDDDVSSSARVISQGNAVPQDGYLGNFSSINSGSWSALMQEAVEASSSETGLHEEWSCLSFQKPEESISNQPPNFVVNEGYNWNFPYTAVGGGKNLFNESPQYSNVIAGNPHFTENNKNKGIMGELRHQHAFQSNFVDGASTNLLVDLCSQHITPQISQSMLERATSNAAAPPNIPQSAIADSSTSHKNSPINQISLPKQYISNQQLSHYQYPSVHLNPKQPQKDHYISQNNTEDSRKTLYSQNTFYDLFSLTDMNLTSIDPTKVTSTGIAKNSTNSLNQDQTQDVYDKVRMPSFSSDEMRNPNEYSHLSGNTGSASRSVQGNTCSKDTTLQFGSKSPKRGCDGGPPHDVRQIPKKQKADTSARVSWFRVVDGSHQRLYNVRSTEQGWAQATNRLIENVEDTAKLKEDVPSSQGQNRKRLVLTTQLTGQLFPALQFEYLTKDASLAYEKITYCVTRSALEEACTLVNQKFSDNSAGGSSLSESVQNIMQKSNNLESSFLRLDKRSSVVDLKLMWQELERYGIVSLLGKFHTQSRHVKPEGTSNSQNAPQRHLAQRRHATLVVLQIDTASLHGVPCLSL